jgi:formamidopyrimidine-DNA glycosylase
MPELPDIVVYVESLRRLLVGQTIDKLIIRSPFMLRTFEPSIDMVTGRKIVDFDRCGKRVVWCLEGQLYLVFHLMIAGRFHWSASHKMPTGKNDLAAIQTPVGTMKVTEASSTKRAGLWLLTSLEAVYALSAGGLDVMQIDVETFERQLRLENRTLKRALTDPRLFDGIGNAYSDEILHAARLSPLKRTEQLDRAEVERLYVGIRETLGKWTKLLREQAKGGFPEHVTAFRPEMAVHGKFGEKCPVCEAPVQRIRYAENECNYCPGCQTDRKILADRSLSRLLKDDWPRSLDEL